MNLETDHARIQGDPEHYEVWIAPIRLDQPDVKGYTKHWRIELREADGTLRYVFQVNGKDKSWYNKAQARNEAEIRIRTQNWAGRLREVA